jgi:hypothetical protein
MNSVLRPSSVERNLFRSRFGKPAAQGGLCPPHDATRTRTRAMISARQRWARPTLRSRTINPFFLFLRSTFPNFMNYILTAERKLPSSISPPFLIPWGCHALRHVVCTTTAFVISPYMLHRFCKWVLKGEIPCSIGANVRPVAHRTELPRIGWAKDRSAMNAVIFLCCLRLRRWLRPPRVPLNPMPTNRAGLVYAEQTRRWIRPRRSKARSPAPPRES